MIDCPATSGSPVSLEALPSGPFEIYAAVNSSSTSRAFVLRDAQGRGVRSVDLEMTLPDTPAALVFQSGFGYDMPTPKRVRVTTLSSCFTQIPNVIAGPDAGVFNATVRVSSTGAAFTIPIHVVNTQSYVTRIFPGDPLPPYATPVAVESQVILGASVEWSDGLGHSGPLAGVPVTVTAPASGPTVVFANGAQQITVISNASGGAIAPARQVGGAGSFVVRSTYPDGGLANVSRYVALGAPEVQLPPSPSIEYGSRTEVRGSVLFAGYPCDLDLNNFIPTTLAVNSNGVGLPARGLQTFASSGTTCGAEGVRIPFGYVADPLPFGTWPVTVEAAHRYGLMAAGSKTMSVTVVPAATVQAATGRGSIRLGAADPGYSLAMGKCTVSGAQGAGVSSPDFPPTRPDAVELPFGAVRFGLRDCTWVDNSGFGEVPLPPIAQRVLLEVDEILPAGTTAWAYGPTSTNQLPHWHELRTSVVGRMAQFEVTDAGLGDDSLARDGVIRPLIALGVPNRASLQDLWWAGTAENGWGMSLTQHRDTLFAALFIYDALGDPRWVVMSGGSWNADRTAYTGDVYRPKGTPLAEGIAAGFNPGSAIGTLRLTPLSQDTLRLDYIIDGVTGTRNVRRQAFGPVHPYPYPRFDDLWWGGIAENGWGFALAQQYRSFFGVLYTYDSRGDPTWFVAPASTLFPPFTLQSVFDSPLYRTRGSPWLGATYDPSKLVVTEVGKLRMFVRDGWELAHLTLNIAGWRGVTYVVTRQPF